jgi:endonuclease III
MRGATEAAKRLKVFASALRSKLGKVGHLPTSDPITQLLLGVMSRDAPESKAAEGLERLHSMVVDYNELRVVPPTELAAALEDFPDGRLKGEDISRALNAIFAQEHSTTLGRLANLPRKDAAAALEKIDGLEPYTRARIRLLGLGHHAVPLDEAMWALARREGLVDNRCPLAEAQAFLERQIAEEDALDFVALMKRYAWSEMGGAVRRREVEHIRSVPPDRTTRNMLRMIISRPNEPVGELAVEEVQEPPPEVPAPRPPKKEAKPEGRRAAARGKPKSKTRPVSVATGKTRGGGRARPAKRSKRVSARTRRR